jgi:hypothetical protein
LGIAASVSRPNSWRGGNRISIIAGLGLIFVLFALASSVFWIWMLVAAIGREQEPSERVIWVLVILFLHFVGALLYFFMRYTRPDL